MNEKNDLIVRGHFFYTEDGDSYAIDYLLQCC